MTDKTKEHKYQYDRLKANYSFVDPEKFKVKIGNFCDKARHADALKEIGIETVGDYIAYQASCKAWDTPRLGGMGRSTLGSVARAVNRFTGIEKLDVRTLREGKTTYDDIKGWLGLKDLKEFDIDEFNKSIKDK